MKEEGEKGGERGEEWKGGRGKIGGGVWRERGHRYRNSGNKERTELNRNGVIDNTETIATRRIEEKKEGITATYSHRIKILHT